MILSPPQTGGTINQERNRTVNKGELIEALAETWDVPKAQAGRQVAALLDVVVKTLNKGQKVSITGFGTFSVTKRAARKARNPRTGEPVKVPAAKVPKFSAGASFKEAVQKAKV